MDQYQYMVPYSFGNGVGRAFITRTAPMSTPEDIEDIEKQLREKNGYMCAVTGFFLLSHTTTNDETGA